MTLRVGGQVWVPCEVKPGPFSDERMVRVRTEQVDWLGFVPMSALKDQITEGDTFIRALVVNVANGHFAARLPGHAVTSSIFHGDLGKVSSIGSLQA